MNFDVGKGDEVEYSELPALKQLVAMGYPYLTQNELNNERNDFREVLLYKRLRDAINKINEGIDDEGIESAIQQIHERNFQYEWEQIETNQKIYAKLTALSRTGGLEPITVVQYNENGPYDRTVRFFDFKNAGTKDDKNDYLVTNQFLIRGFKNDSILPDIVLFVNGIPLVTIECKSPFLPEDPIVKAVEKENFKKYQSRGLGYEKLIFYNHILVATCGVKARHGTILASVNHYSRWSSAPPLSLEEIEEKYGKSREQEVLIAGMLNKKTLLDLLKNFVVYEVEEGKLIKKIAKHQQHRAVTECIKKLKTADSNRGGVVWHTQGSGKSLTMQWFAFQAHRIFGDMPLVLVTDRRQLDKQIFDKFTAVGFPNPKKADDASELEEFLDNPKGKTLMTTIQKFSEVSNSTQEKALVLVDEAHRTQYGTHAQSLDKALPNAIRFAFTGTPIDKNDKSTYQVFGDMIDHYGFEESKQDGNTLPIRYIGKLPHLFIEGGETVDDVFDRVIGQDKSVDETMKARLKKEYVSKSDIAEAPSRIKQIVLKILEHYKNIEENGYKAMIIASSREAAVIYYNLIKEMNGPLSKIVMDVKKGEFGKDRKSWDDHYLTDSQIRKIEDDFTRQDNPTKILIVVDMLLVGFDAPIVQVMYLDKGLREHNLLQAIARVNRVYDEPKDHGLIIDFYGITKEIRKAFDLFDDADVKGAWEPDDYQLEILKQRQLNALTHIKGMDLNNEEELIERFETADSRDNFEEDFKLFSKTLNAQMYKKESEQYMIDFKKLCKIRYLIRREYYEKLLSTKPYANKIQKIIDDAVRGMGVSEIVPEREITRENFISKIKKLKSGRARTALIKNKATQVIMEQYPTNPKYYEKLKERLEELIKEEEDRRKKNAKWFDPEFERKLQDVYEKAMGEKEEKEKLGFNYPIDFPIYTELQSINDNSEQSQSSTKQISEKIMPLTNVVGWKDKTSIEKKMTEIMYDELNGKISNDKLNEVSKRMISLVKTIID